MNSDNSRQKRRPLVSRWQERWYAFIGMPRALLFGGVILVVMTVFTWRLWNLQFVQGETYSARADEQRLREITVATSRGIIYDRNGQALVRNVPDFNVVVVPAYLPEDGVEREQVLRRLAQIVDVTYSSARILINDEPAPPGLVEMLDEVTLAGYYQPLMVKRGVDRDVALLVAQEALTMPGVSVQVNRRRDYSYGPLVSQLLGYTLPIPAGSVDRYRADGYDPATDRIGMAGVEASYEQWLRGQKGQRVIEEDVIGRQIRVVEEPAVPVPGANVYLTLDLDLQQYVEDRLLEGMADPKVNSPRGVAIVMKPQTGEVLAMVSLPTYDNNLFVKGISTQDWQRLSEDPHRPLINHAISDALPPGSVYKIIVASGALQESVLTPRTQFECLGRMEVANKYYPNDPGRAQPFYCWNLGGHGWLDVVGGLAHSCDIFFYKTGGGFEEDRTRGLGVAGIAHYSELFGLGRPTGIELPGEVGGLVPTADWKRLTFGEHWATGDTYNLSIGQGFVLATPLQMINAVNIIANGGTYYRPQIVHHVTDAHGEVMEQFTPEIVRELPISPENISLVQQGMEGAVAYGTAPRAQIEGIRVAGKTGTAQYCDDIALETGICGEGLEQPTHAWFAAYAPVENPEVSVIVFVYNGGEGSTVCSPIAHDIMLHYFGLDEAPADEDEAAL
ncbi:MAG: penicillin-binding protein 2 [Chloroflexi bacterium]|nr:penicillin-binding protein 2 [Chloroflexota bacterium]